MISVGALAVGYFLMNIFSPPANLSGDVCTTLFGSTLILTLTKTDMILSVVISALVILFFIIFYNRIFAVTFDEDFSFAGGTNTRLMNIVMAAVIATIIVLAMNLVGTLLISALIIFPAVSSMQLFKSFKRVIVFACGFSVFCAIAGIFISILAGTPVGSTIVIIDIAGFVICKLVSLVLHRS
jgi:zinc transport system permease protein